MDALKNVLIFASVVVFCLTVIFSGLANVARIDGIEMKENLFPNGFSYKDTLVAPMDNIYSVWVFIYIYQMCLVSFAVSLVFRSNSPDVLNKKFYATYIMAFITNIIWMFIWSRQMYSLGFVFYVLQAVFLEVSLYFAYSAYENYYQSSPIPVSSGFDFWSFHIFVINGIAFFTGWVSSTALVDLAVVLQADLDVAPIAASKVSLSLVLVSVLLWSALQNSVCEKFTRFMFAEYIPLIVVLAGVIAKKWRYEHEDVRSFALALFIITLMLLIFRIGMILTREIKRGALPLRSHEAAAENVNLI